MGLAPPGPAQALFKIAPGNFVPVSVRLCPPSMASRPCHSRFGSPISAGTQPPRCHIAKKATLVWL
ncbi:hypothetical protein CYD30_03070 [Kosakonia cowanii]|nr:hypothetical protein CYD30_03070 [Kosakonia cowanii]